MKYYIALFGSQDCSAIGPFSGIDRARDFANTHEIESTDSIDRYFWTEVEYKTNIEKYGKIETVKPEDYIP